MSLISRIKGFFKSKSNGLGHIILPDVRDENFPLSIPLGAVKETDLLFQKWQIGRIYNQGSEPTCVGYALNQILRSSPYVDTNPPPPGLIYEKAKQIDEFQGKSPVGGTSLRAGLTVLRTLDKIDSYYWANSVDEIIRYIRSVGPLVTGTQWETSMSMPDWEGRVKLGGGVMGGHAYVIYGVDLQRKVFLCANSWGEDWGHSGTFIIDINTFGYLFTTGVAAAPVEHL